MKTIGLIGGISWVSTLDYYRYINTGINDRLGGNASAHCLIHSFNYADIAANNHSGNMEGNYRLMRDAAHQLSGNGAQCLLLCANTAHMFAERLQEELSIPLLHIADATGKAIRQQGLHTVALLGTRFTMEMGFVRDRLKGMGIDTVIPEGEDRDFVHRTVFEELGQNIILDTTRRRYQEIIDKLIAQGAQGVILGCTEIPLLLQQEHVPVPVFDTTRLHAAAAVAFALGDTD